MKPKIYAKSALTREQASVKARIGCDALEVQLLGELIINKAQSIYRPFEQVFDIEAFSKKYDVDVIHMPIPPGVGDLPLESLIDVKDFPLLIQVFDMAQKFAEMQGHTVGIVIHSETFYDKLLEEDVWPDLVEQVGWLLGNHKDVVIYLENVSPLRGVGKGKQLHLANNFAFDNVEMVKRLREELKTERIFTCLDICHAMLAEKYLTVLYKEVGDVPMPDLSMERYFIENKDVIGLIHLCDIYGSGYGKGRHGVPFKESTYPKLESILDLYVKYSYECPLTLEVEEQDFSICDGYAGTKKLVDRYFDKLSE